MIIVANAVSDHCSRIAHMAPILNSNHLQLLQPLQRPINMSFGVCIWGRQAKKLKEILKNQEASIPWPKRLLTSHSCLLQKVKVRSKLCKTLSKLLKLMPELWSVPPDSKTKHLWYFINHCTLKIHDFSEFSLIFSLKGVGMTMTILLQLSTLT